MAGELITCAKTFPHPYENKAYLLAPFRGCSGGNEPHQRGVVPNEKAAEIAPAAGGRFPLALDQRPGFLTSQTLSRAMRRRVKRKAEFSARSRFCIGASGVSAGRLLLFWLALVAM